ncbi:lantibiotic protection ABC transporter ATP-binding protein [Vagococcus intermedius]|uniref:Lantibiotic protection ABC transporter ATP-binding protein n=1 Tax=Vagococcus intermedius TaxID=2991418 RepID=A0AAF0CWB0_9ENTE|nr:lantibiotic protection ABC transporter ATP-binding protein [Vagococcus intermedius]WEG74022.1 lantibiotic protection ABC transporter ATP-binding protein [Vagococcus intermedius]WEG76102.1 lantibiotic protection ABC transporter ATP-binding protein [Vagococcus intermedius]
MTYYINTKNLTKVYGDEAVLEGIDLAVRNQTIYGLLGPNGAGKTTLLKILTGIIKPSAGEIKIQGQVWKREDLEGIGALIEQPAIYPNLTAYENLKVQAILLGIADQRILEVLALVNLTNTGRKKSGKFSLGMKQRLGIASALLGSPKLLILDEPTNGLDPLGIQELRELIKDLPLQGITVILSSHILSEVQQIADDIGIISHGKLGYQGVNHQETDLEQLFLEVVTHHAKERGES